MSLYDVIIIGGGIAGLATAASLQRRGVANILILEKASALRPVGAAIGLFPHGLAALEQVSPDAFKRVIAAAIPMKKNVMRDADSGVVLSEHEIAPSTSATHPNMVYMVWYLLQRYLREDVSEVRLWLCATATTFVEDEHCVTVEGLRAGESFAVRAKVVVGADGIRSAVRRSLWKKCALTYHGKMMLRSCVDVSALEEGMCPALGVQERFVGSEEGKMFSVRETSPGIATVTAMANFDNPFYAADADARKARMQDMFRGYPEAVQHVIQRTPSYSFLESAIYDIEVVEEWSKGRVVLIGDAAHAMCPVLGQGANMGLEDAAELSYALAPMLRDTKIGREQLCQSLRAFWTARKERVCAVHLASREKSAAENRSMRGTGPGFLGTSVEERQQLELFLQNLYKWRPSIEPPLVKA